MLLLLRWFCLLQDVPGQTFTDQNKLAAVAPKETITHHFFVSGIGRRKLSMAQNLWRRKEMLLKQKTQQNTGKMDFRSVYYLAFIPAVARAVLLTIIV